MLGSGWSNGKAGRRRGRRWHASPLHTQPAQQPNSPSQQQPTHFQASCRRDGKGKARALAPLARRESGWA